MQSEKYNKLANITKQKQTHKLREGTYGYWGEELWEGIVREFGIDKYTLLYLK